MLHYGQKFHDSCQVIIIDLMSFGFFYILIFNSFLRIKQIKGFNGSQVFQAQEIVEAVQPNIVYDCFIILSFHVC
jgi:hypothetical protein